MDLTKITTPFGLLDAETQEALRTHGGPYEWYRGNPHGWADDDDPDASFYDGSIVVRVKPQPTKPREWWIVGGCEAYSSKADAESAQGTLHFQQPIIHVREVLE